MTSAKIALSFIVLLAAVPLAGYSPMQPPIEEQQHQSMAGTKNKGEKAAHGFLLLWVAFRGRAWGAGATRQHGVVVVFAWSREIPTSRP